MPLLSVLRPVGRGQQCWNPRLAHGWGAHSHDPLQALHGRELLWGCGSHEGISASSQEIQGAAGEHQQHGGWVGLSPQGRAVAFMRDVAHCILCGLNKKAGHAHAELGHDQSNYMFTVDLKTMKSLSPFKPFYIQAVTYLLTHLFINRNLGLLRIFTLAQTDAQAS